MQSDLCHIISKVLLGKKSINALEHLESKQCIVVGNVTSNYPVFVEVSPETGVVMGGETRRLVS
jgi:hypothetical protein